MAKPGQRYAVDITPHPKRPTRYPNEPDDQLLIPQNALHIDSCSSDGPGSRSVVGSAGIDAARAARWSAELSAGRELWAHGEWSALGWADNHKQVVAASNGSVTTAPVVGGSSEDHCAHHGWFRVYNAASELDAPGEYTTGMFGGSLLLLVYPPPAAGKGGDGAVMSMSAGPLVSVTNTSGVSFRGLEIMYGRSWGAVFENCDGCGIADGVVANTGINGVNVTGGRNFMLDATEVTGTGQGGVILEGGDRQTLRPGNHTIRRCRVHRFGRILQKYTPAVCLTGVGHTITNSTVSDGAHFGMLLTGNDHTVSANHFHTLVYGGADAGAIYSGRDWTYRGQLITGNVFENISSYLCDPGGGGTCLGQAPRALHSDDGMSGWTVTHNRFVNVTMVHNAYSSRDMVWTHNRIEHVRDVRGRGCTVATHFELAASGPRTCTSYCAQGAVLSCLRLPLADVVLI